MDVNLFAGAGGLSIGLQNAGFCPSHFFEIDPSCCETLRNNINSKRSTLDGTVHEDDVRNIDWGPFSGKVRLLAGGVPCQPFSLAGKHLAERDDRNLFPEMLRAIRIVRPSAILIENVRGLLRNSFQPYFEYIIRQLTVPSIEPRSGESWLDHDQRIRRHQYSFDYEPEYSVSYRLLNAADYGVPQNRHRVFIIAIRMGLPPYVFPDRTHSRDALKRSQVSGEYWKERGLRKPRELSFSERNNGKEVSQEYDERLPWVTVRDGLSGLPKPASLEADASSNHWVIPGARIYPGHRGSVIDWPAKTIKAGVHGVPGGENVVVDAEGNARYFTLRETARLQTFPDNHFFKGARLHVTRQVGNAVPCRLGEVVARALYKFIEVGSKPMQKIRL